MPHIYHVLLIPAIYLFRKPIPFKVMDLETNRIINKKTPALKQQQKEPQQKQQAPNNSWFRFVFTVLHTKSCVGFICLKFRS